MPPESNRQLDYSAYLGPKYWGLWLAIGLGCVLAWLPFRIQQGLGSVLGRLAYWLMKRRRRDTQTNIALCFPELSPEQQKGLVKRSFRSNAIGLIEAVRSWTRTPESLRSRTAIHGLENLHAALERGKGVILLGAHYSTLDLVGSLTTLFFEADVLQRDHKNPLFNAYMTRSRGGLYGEVLDKTNIRGMFRRLRDNKVIWYATDQDSGDRNVVFAPFFGHPASTLVTTGRLANKSGAAVVPFSHFRRPNCQGYDIYIHPMLENFPTDNAMQDATRLNAFIETEIRKHPEQYLWMHRRFKSQPDSPKGTFYR